MIDGVRVDVDVEALANTIVAEDEKAAGRLGHYSSLLMEADFFVDEAVGQCRYVDLCRMNEHLRVHGIFAVVLLEDG